MVATQQYDACMGIMVRINVDELVDLQNDFDEKPDGLKLEEFLNVMLDRLSWNADNVLILVRDLIELFAQVDINGDGTMEWEEFTSFVIEAGMGDSNKNIEWVDFRYEEDLQFVQSSKKQPSHIEYLPQLRKLFFFESNRPVIQIYDTSPISMDKSNYVPRLRHLGELHPLSHYMGYRKDQDETRSEHSCVQAIKHLDKLDTLVISAGDLSLTFWNETTLFTLETPEPLAIVSTQHPQRKLAWSHSTRRMYGIDTGHYISCWMVEGNNQKCEISILKKLRKHRDIIQDILMVNDMTLVSAGMDSMINVWDTTTNELKTTYYGHSKGIRCLAPCSDTAFASAGFEYDILVWDVSGLISTPLFKLWGHTSPVKVIHPIPNRDNHLISVDDEGCFRWWDVQKDITMEENDRCLQTFHVNSENYTWTPHSFVILNGGNSILAASHKLKLIARTRIKPKTIASCTIVYNAVSFTILTTTDRDVKIWDAVTGVLLRTYHNISQSEITNICLDDRQRKFILCNQGGEILCFNYLNGAPMKAFPPHKSEVSSTIYCNEDKCLLTCSWDRKICIFDDICEDSLLRVVENAHDSDITCIAYSYSLSLVATCSNDGTLRVWDYVYFVCDGECSVLFSRADEHDDGVSPVTSIVFLEPYPILVSGHENGHVCFWPVRPWKGTKQSPVYQLLYDFSPEFHLPNNVAEDDAINQPDDAQCAIDKKVGITDFQAYYDPTGGDEIAQGITTGRYFLFVSNDFGRISCWNVAKFLTSFGIQSIPEDDWVASLASYNPRRRIARDGSHAAQIKKQKPVHVQLPSGHDTAAKNVPQVVECTWFVWGHEGTIRKTRVVYEPLCLLSCSNDKTSKVWNIETGQCLGYLGENRTKPKDSSTTTVESPIWELQVETQSNERMKMKEAQDLWDKIKARHESAVKNKRMMEKKEKERGTTASGGFVGPTRKYAKRSSGAKTTKSRQGSITPLSTPFSTKDKRMDEQERLFEQLQGVKSWKKSQVEIAKEEAWAREQEKLKNRLQKIIQESEAKNNAIRDEEDVAIDEMFSDFKEKEKPLASLTDDSRAPESSSHVNILGTSTRAPSSVVNLPFEEKDNWSVLSLNRQKQMYGNLYEELLRGNRNMSLKEKHRQKMEAMEISPSSFLQQQFKDSAELCGIRDDLKMVNRINRLRRIQSIEMNKLRFSLPADTLESSESLLALHSNQLESMNEETSRLASTKKDGNEIPLHTSPSFSKLERKHSESLMKISKLSRQISGTESSVKRLGRNSSFGKKSPSLRTLNKPRSSQSTTALYANKGSLKTAKCAQSSTKLIVQTEQTPKSIRRSVSYKDIAALSPQPLFRSRTFSRSIRHLQRNPQKLDTMTNSPLKSSASLSSFPSCSPTSIHVSKSCYSTSTLEKSVSSRSLSTVKRQSVQRRVHKIDDILSNLSRLQVPKTGKDAKRKSTLEALSKQQDTSRSTDTTNSIPEVGQKYQKTEGGLLSRFEAYLEEQEAMDIDVKKQVLAIPRTAHLSRTDSSSSNSSLLSNGTSTKSRSSTGNNGRKAAIKGVSRLETRIMTQDHFGPYSRDEVRHVGEIFSKIDKDNSGTIEMKEFKQEAVLLESNWMRENVMSIFSSVDKDESGEIELGELFGAIFSKASPSVVNEMCTYMSILNSSAEKPAVQKKKTQLSQKQVDELRELFRLYDTDSSGSIDARELFKGLHQNQRDTRPKHISPLRMIEEHEEKQASILLTDIERIISEFDQNENCELEMEEFIDFFRDVA